jgi:hypothetical protein
MALDRGEDFLLARFLGDVEWNEAAARQPDVSDDGAVGTMMEMKEGMGLELELGRLRFTQLAELAKLVQKVRKPFEPSPAASSSLRPGQSATPVGAIPRRVLTRRRADPAPSCGPLLGSSALRRCGANGQMEIA